MLKAILFIFVSETFINAISIFNKTEETVDFKFQEIENNLRVLKEKEKKSQF